VAISREFDDPPAALGAMQGLSLAYLRLGDSAGAAKLASEAIEIADRTGDRYSAAFNFFSLGVIALRARDLATAADRFGAAMQRSQEAQAPIGIAVALDAHAELALALTDGDSAARLAGAAQRMRGEMGGAPSMTLAGIGAPLESARERMDPEDFERAAAAGAAMSTEAAIALAFSVGEAARHSPAASS
jgi:hypothetical protein